MTPRPSAARSIPSATAGDPGGPLLALCLGPRCSALRALAGTQDSVGELQESVRCTRGGVLVTAACLGPCALAAVAAVAHRDGATGRTSSTVWLTGVHETPRASALAEWISAGGPPPDCDPDTDLPVPLIEAVAGLGAPVRLAPEAS